MTALKTSAQILAELRLNTTVDWDAMFGEMMNRVEKEPGKGLVDLTQAAKLLNVPTNTNQALADLAAEIDSIAPMTTLGDLIVGGPGGAPLRFPGNTSTSRRFLSQIGTGGNSNYPIWELLQENDIPALHTSKINSGVFSVARGGTGLSNLGASLQYLRVNSVGNALEYANLDPLPNQSGNANKVLSTDGSSSSWQTIASILGYTPYDNANPAGYINSSALTPYLLSSTAASTYYPLTNPSGFITSAALSGYVQGNGTVNAIPKFTGSGTIGAGVIVDNNTSININIPSGFGIGTGAANRRRIVYGVDAATAFTFLTDSDGYSPIYAGLGSVITAGTATVDSTLLTVQNTNSDGGAVFRILRQNGATGGIRTATVNLNNEWYAGINRNGGNASTQYSISNNLDTTLATTLLRFSAAGLLRLGATSVTPIVTTTGFFIGNNHIGATDLANINAEGTIQSDVTGSYRGFRSAPSTVASVFTVTDLSHFNASFGMQGVGSVITNQYGFIANPNLTNAVNNYGFYGAIPAGANRWNCYMLGTAANYFAGNLLLGTTTNNGVDRLQVNGSARINSTLTVGSLAGTGTRIVTADTNGVLEKILGTASQYVRGDGSLATFPSITGLVPYTGATANVNLGTFDLTADVITGTTGSYTSSGNGNTLGVTHSSGSGIALNITKGGNGEGLYINKTSGSGNAATIIGTLNATTLVKSGGTASQFLKADGSIDSNSYLTSINGIAAGGDLSGTYQSPNVSGLLGYPLPFFGGIDGDTLLLGKDILTGDWTTISLSNIITFSKLSEPLYVNTDLFGNKFLDIRVATASQNGVLSSSAFTTFTNKQNAITLTTTGTSGAATFLGDALNVPNYTLAGLDGVPTGRTLTINGTAFDLSANRSWNVGTVTGVTGTTNRITSSGGATPIIDIASTYVGQLSITTLGTIGTGVWQGTAIGDTYISSAAIWNAKIGGSLTTGYLPVATGAGTVANSVLFQNGNNIGIGVNPLYNLHIQDSKALGLYSYLENTSSNSIASASYIAKSQSGVTIGMTALNQGMGALINSSHNLTIEASGGGGMVLQTNGQIITNGAVNSGEHFIIGGNARFNGVVRAPQISTTKQTLTPTGTTQTIDWNNGSIIDLLLSSATGNVTLTLLNAQASSYLIEVTNGATPRNLIFPTGTLQSNGGGNVYVGIANRKDVIAVLWDGNQYLISVVPNFA